MGYLDSLDENEISDEHKVLRAQIAAIKAGKNVDAKALLPIVASDDLDSDTEGALLALAVVARRKGDKTAKQVAGVVRKAFENHVAAIAKKPKKWFAAELRSMAMKSVRGDVAFAEPLLAKAMKAKTDVDFLRALILMVSELDKARAKRMYAKVQETAKTKPEWVFPMPAAKPARR